MLVKKYKITLGVLLITRINRIVLKRCIQFGLIENRYNKIIKFNKIDS